MVSVGHFFGLSCIVFCIGIFGLMLNRKSVISLLISFEIILLAAGINFVSFARYYFDVSGQIASLFVLAIAACEVAVGLALISVHFKNTGSIEIADISSVKDV